MRFRFEECLERGKIVRIPVDPALVDKELREAESDLAAAERSLTDQNGKWAIIQGCYSIFHSLRALVLQKGYREKGHRCLKYAAEALLVDEGLLDNTVLGHFSYAMDLREGLITGASMIRDRRERLLNQHGSCMLWSTGNAGRLLTIS